MTQDPDRKPRIVVAGEFSAGKSRLINGLIGTEVLPSNVTATSLPPIWLSAGEPGMTRVALDGTVTRIETLDGVDLEQTAYCTVAIRAPILEWCDLIDTPGNSDPNIPPESWERMLGHADTLIWCSPAMQAWRQSEKAVVCDMPPELLEKATLLVTQADRLPDDRARTKVERRVRRDTGALFDEVMLASLLDAGDLERIGERVKAASVALAERPGLVSPLIEKPAKPTKKAATRKTKRKRAAAKPKAKPAQAELPPEMLQIDNVIDIVRAVQLLSSMVQDATSETVQIGETTAPDAPEDKDHDARRIWNDLIGTADLSDTPKVLEAVEVLLQRLDARNEPPRGPRIQRQTITATQRKKRARPAKKTKRVARSAAPLSIKPRRISAKDTA